MKNLLLSLILLSTSSYAGLNGLTHHSRANCFNNESISWDAIEDHKMFVRSMHISYPANAFIHLVDSNKLNYDLPPLERFTSTWRAGAVCWGELPHPDDNYKYWWSVSGQHIYVTKENKLTEQGTGAKNCNLYEGWWNFDKDDINKKSNAFDFLNTPPSDGKRREVSVIGNTATITIAGSNQIRDPFPELKKYTQHINFINIEDSIVPKETIFKQMNDQKTNGYYYEDSEQVTTLLEYKYYAKVQKKVFGLIKNPFSTSLKDNVNEIKLSFKFQSIPFIPKNDVIGFAPYNTYNKDKQGWTAIKEIFNYSGIGTCYYEVMDLESSNAKIYIVKDTITHEVNNKITIKNTKGNENTGFMYVINWFNRNFDYKLSCANMAYKKNIDNRVTELAKNIDKENDLYES